MKQDGGAEAVSVAEVTSALLHPLNLGVETLTCGVGDFVDHGVGDAPQLVTHGASDSAHGLEPRAKRPPEPALPGAQCPTSAHVLPQAPGCLLDGPGSRDDQRVPPRYRDRVDGERCDETRGYCSSS